ncbi:hypothetical protein [Thioalkalivibrio sp. HK1]|uniref:hypothetical protein n=1 Tax=Thioalkalivibrio sp. HK1 TaxID=1469245 RepID=UPI0012DFD275|nr:hypothetical protein [Thioalkalivibrio sp. HK1]
MPIPLIVWLAVGVAAGGYGIYKGVKGFDDTYKAKEKSRKAKDRYDNNVDKTEDTRKRFMRHADDYGKVQIEVAHDTVGEFLRLLDKLNLKGRSRDAHLLDDLRINPTEIREYRGIIEHANALLGGAASAATAGGTASTATVGLVGLFASAGTGTSIGSLSGAAAQSATLAWLGGGTLASGGGGVALGTFVLGGVVLVPAMLVGGLVLATQGQKALSQARDDECKVNIACEELKTLRDLMEKSKKRVDELEKVLKGLSDRAKVAMKKIDPDDFDSSRSEDLDRFSAAGTLVRGVVSILSTPILDDAGNLSSDSAKVLTRTRKLII